MVKGRLHRQFARPLSKLFETAISEATLWRSRFYFVGCKRCVSALGVARIFLRRRCGVTKNKAEDCQCDENFDDLHKAHAKQHFLIVSCRKKLEDQDGIARFCKNKNPRDIALGPFA